MAYLTRDQVKDVIIRSIITIADLPENVEEASFAGMTAFNKHLFLSTLKSKLNALPYFMNDGTTNHLAYYDVDLAPDSIDDWPTVKDCIDWFAEPNNQKIIYL